MSTFKKCDIPGTLVNKTLTLLAKEPKTMTDMSLETGIPFFWIQRFANHKMTNPSANRVQYLYEYLTKTHLILK